MNSYFVFYVQYNTLPHLKLSNSFTFNWHKWLAAPYEGTVCLYRHQTRWNGSSSTVISQQSAFQYQRRPNILKVNLHIGHFLLIKQDYFHI